METINLPSYGDTMWVISQCDTVEQVKVQKVTYIDSKFERTVKVKTNAGEYSLPDIYETKEMAQWILENKNKLC